MKINFSFIKIFILFFIFSFIKLILCDQGYFQILDDFSFDLRNPNDKKVFYTNYVREGNLIVDKNLISMNTNLEDSYGLFYSKKVF